MDLDIISFLIGAALVAVPLHWLFKFNNRKLLHEIAWQKKLRQIEQDARESFWKEQQSKMEYCLANDESFEYRGRKFVLMKDNINADK